MPRQSHPFLSGLFGGRFSQPAPTPEAQEEPLDFGNLQMIADYAGEPFVRALIAQSQAGAGAAGDQFAAATQTLQDQYAQSQQGLGAGTEGLEDAAGIAAGVDTDLGAAFGTGDAQAALQALSQMGGPFDTSGAQAMLQGIGTDFGEAYDTSGAQSALQGMDFEGTQGRYEDQYVDGVVDPVLSRMREDEARRMAELEASGAAIGGGSNTRMAVEMARTADEGTRSRAETEAMLRSQALRQGQELGLQETSQRGQFAEQAAQLGLTESELMSRIRESEAQAQAQFADQAARLGIAEADQAQAQQQASADIVNMAAQLGLSESELQSMIAQRSAQLGLDQASALQSIANDMSGMAGQGMDFASMLAGQQMARGQGELDAARLGITGLGVGLEQSELERQIITEQMQTPLTLESWYRNIIGTGPASPLPVGGVTDTNETSTTTGTTTQTGGGAGIGTQLLGAGTSLLGAGMQAGLISDERVKEEVEPLTGALDHIRRQRPSSYRYSDPSYDRVPEAGRRSAGLMAQDLEGIPGAVIEHESGVKMVDPYPVMATIAAAVQELDRKVEEMSHG